jgi:hypothetical protein
MVPCRLVRETPDPVPGLMNAGFPVTIRFNPAYCRHVVTKRFRLLDSDGKTIRSKLIRADNDPHRKLSKLDFALVPLKPLKCGKEYSVEFMGLADGNPISRKWRFATGK